MRLFRPATIQVPTVWGWIVILSLLLALPLLWVIKGEAFLSITQPVEADVLVVEGWIGGDGIDFAAAEFKNGGYAYVVAVGVAGEGWRPGNHPDFAHAAGSILRARGINRDRVIEIPIPRLPVDRTSSSAQATRQILTEMGVFPKGLNVVTRGCHARRSRLEFLRAFPEIPVGTKTYARTYEGETRWWHSTERAMEFLDESVKYGATRLRFW